MRLLAGGRLEFNPTSNELGSYIVDVIAFDGQIQIVETLTIDVEADPVFSTRVSGRLLNVDESPIAGLQVEIGSVVGLTQADGSFSLDVGPGAPVTDTLRVRGELLPGPTRFPFIAEKLGLLFEHALQPNVNNVLTRPIYLPVLNDGTIVEPMNDTEVAQVLQTGEAPATVHVKAGTLFTQQGIPFTGRLSVTEVPANRTPAGPGTGSISIGRFDSDEFLDVLVVQERFSGATTPFFLVTGQVVFVRSMRLTILVVSFPLALAISIMMDNWILLPLPLPHQPTQQTATSQFFAAYPMAVLSNRFERSTKSMQRLSELRTSMAMKSWT